MQTVAHQTIEVKSAPRSRQRRAESPWIKAWEGLSFRRRPPRGEPYSEANGWHLPPPPDNYVEAQRVMPDGDIIDRDTALYGVGCRQGAVAAGEYLAFLREHGGTLGGGCLQHIVLSMLANKKGGYLRGQVVGFFSALEVALKAQA